jgi:hypothetical protein
MPESDRSRRSDGEERKATNRRRNHPSEGGAARAINSELLPNATGLNALEQAEAPVRPWLFMKPLPGGQIRKPCTHPNDGGSVASLRSDDGG